MKHFVYADTAFTQPQFGLLMECAEELAHDGDQVVFAYCNGFCDICRENAQGGWPLCALCKVIRRRFIRKMSLGITMLPLNRPGYRTERTFEFKTLQDVRSIRYRSVWIGYAALSSYISTTRNSRPDVANPKMRKYLNHAMTLVADMADWFHDYLDHEHIGAIHIHNGRLLDNRALYDIAVARGIPFYSHEFVGGFRVEQDFAQIVYENGLPHNIDVNTRMMNRLWELKDIPEEVKVREGHAFYEKRRRGVAAADRVYTDIQKEGLLPPGFDRAKENIVVFNSSEDEFAAIGKDYDDFQIFPNQTAGIVSLLENLEPERFRVYVRIHPNLIGVHYDYVDELFELPKRFPHITLIAPDSPVSTYALMDAADKVVVFGSTAGAEAAYAGKPVILAGPSYYYRLGIAYVPKTAQEYIELAKRTELPPLNSANAIKFAYYLLERKQLCKPCKFVDLSLVRGNLFGRKMLYAAYAKLWNSCFLFKLVRILVVRGTRRFGKWKMPDDFFDERRYA